MSDLGTVFFSKSIDSLGRTLIWTSPELLDSSHPDSTIRPTHESDCYAVGMVIYEVTSYDHYSDPSLTCPVQILTGFPPFHGLSVLQIMLALATGGHPVKPLYPESLGLSDELWELVQSCWSKSISVRPTAQELYDHLSHASLGWVPPLQWPIPDPYTSPYLPTSPCITPPNLTNKV